MTKKERRQLSDQLDKHRGEWVAVRGAEVIGAASTIEELERQVDLQPGDRKMPVRTRHSEPYLRR